MCIALYKITECVNICCNFPWKVNIGTAVKLPCKNNVYVEQIVKCSRDISARSQLQLFSRTMHHIQICHIVYIETKKLTELVDLII